MANLQLQSTDARLLYLALQYHLARPGSELQSEAGQEGIGGLRDAAAALEPQLDLAVTQVDLSADQLRRLDAALGGAINELKAIPLLDAGGQSTIPVFIDALHRLFPEVADSPEEALPLAGHMLQLRRRLAAQAPTDDTTENDATPWWRFWRRTG